MTLKSRRGVELKNKKLFLELTWHRLTSPENRSEFLGKACAKLIKNNFLFSK